MEVRLNKLISDSGLCSRREADKFIEMGRVTVNGKQPEIGQKVTEKDIVLVDGERIRIGKRSFADPINSEYERVGNLTQGTKSTVKRSGTSEKRIDKTAQKSFSKDSENGSTTHVRREHYIKYNKYAAARKAAKEKTEQNGKPKVDKEKVLKEALQPRFGKSLSRSAVAQRLASSAKSASLRKTSKNNPKNKAIRDAKRDHR